MTKHPNQHIPLPYDGGDPNEYPSPAQFGGPLDVGTYVGQKAAALVAVKRWISMGGSGPVCTA